MISCEKDDSFGSNGKIELYLLESYTTLQNSNQINERSVITKSIPLLQYSDFRWYDSTEHKFALSELAKENILNLEHSTSGIPFAVMANESDIIYTGYFWPSYSSKSCDCIVIDPMIIFDGNQFQVQLGYPGLSPNWDLPDRRNDKRLLRILNQDHKLR